MKTTTLITKNSFKLISYSIIGAICLHLTACRSRQTHPLAETINQQMVRIDGGELVQDAYDTGYYRYSPQDNPNNAQHSDSGLSHKSVRGGSFSYDADESQNYRRDFASQSIIMSDMGLRLAKDSE
ncbi:hypothetical protein VHP8226_03304 [Vibrio hippocampi]|uniref:Uncharacterized protein n=1 Tax=Vibrio hippocampi TaxID=654686 RepID=A0ABN8DKB3_9VIBR|nr:hypothetical protein VHP8226_03304 [Vibrio hippocampi]